VADDQPQKPRPRPKIKSSFGAVLNNTQKRVPDSEQPESPPLQDTSTLVSPSPDIPVHQDTSTLVSPSPDIPVHQDTSNLVSPSPDISVHQNTNSLVSPSPDISVHQNTNSLVSPSPDIPVHQDTNSPVSPSPATPVPQETNILPSKKTKEKRTKKGVYLKPATAKWLDIQAAIEGREISEITEEALNLLRKVREGKAEVTEI
jgi:hypothetical protein